MPTPFRCGQLAAGLIRARAHAAFTLMELLLAIGIFAMVLLAIQSVFFNALSLRNRTVDQLANSVPLEHALEILRRDLAGLVPPGGSFSGPFQSVDSGAFALGPAAAPSTNFNRANLPGIVVSPELYTGTGIIDEQHPWGEIARVTYYLGEPTNNSPGHDLVRAVTRNLLPIVEDEPEHQWLLGGVDQLQFLYFDGLNWIESWDSSTAATPLPSALKIRLWLTPAPETESRSSDPIELVVPLVVQAENSETESTSGEGGS